MYFERLALDAFGTLDGLVSLEPERINLIQAPNESGKSTLARAVVGVLYGLVSDKRLAVNEEGLTERDLLEPWSGEAYRVSADLAGSPSLRVRRDLDRERLVVYDRSSGKEVTEAYRNAEGGDCLGRELTGLSRTAFEKSLIVHQNDVSLDGSRGELVRAIQRMADTSSGNVTARRAREVIDCASESFPGRFVADRGSLDTELERVKERIDEVDAELRDLRRRRDRAEEKVERADELKERVQEVEEELDRIELFESIARKREYEETLRKHDRRKRKLDELNEEREELERFEGFPHGQQEHLLRSHEQRNQMAEQIEEYREREKQVQKELESVREKLHGMGGPGRMDSEEVDELMEFSEQALHYRSELDASHRELEEEREKLDEHEELLEEFRRLQFRFRDLDGDSRAFLSDMRSRLRTLSDQAAESEREISEARKRIRSIDLERSRIKVRFAVISVVFGLFIAIGGVVLVWVADFQGTIGSLLTLAGILGGGYSVFRWLRAERHRSDERSEWKVKLDNQVQRQKEKARTRRSLRKRATILAGTLGLDGVTDLLEKYGRYRDLYEKLSSLIEVEAQVQRQNKKLENMIRSCESLLDRCDVELTPSSSVEEFRELKETLDRCRDLRKRVADLETKQASIWADRSALERKKEVEERNIQSILDRAGIETEEQSLDEAVETFKSHHEKYIRLQSIKQKIPEVRDGMLSAEKREETQQMLEQLQEHLETVREEWSDVDVPDELGNQDQYRRRRNTLDRRKRTLIAERADLEREVGSMETTFRRQYADLQDEKEELTAYRNRLVRLNRSVELATDVMEQVSRDVHANWARTLNEYASNNIERITPGYTNVEFDENLSFTLEKHDREAPLSPVQVQESLSEGTRNQIYLAVRLSLGKYLTDRENPLPIILDEPFAHWDDERFERTLRLLAEEFLPEHQIVYLTCHGSRMDWLKERDPEWFNRTFAPVEL